MIDTRTPAEAIGARIRDLRELRGLTQRDIAERSGIARPNVSRLEGGRQKTAPSIDSLVRIAQALDVRLADLVATVEVGL